MKMVAYKFKYIRWKLNVKQNITEHFKPKQQKSFMSFYIVTTLLFFQPPPRSSFVLTMSPLPIILIVNLSVKSNQKPIE